VTELITSNNPNNVWGQSIVEVILKLWSYSKTYTVKVGGNCHGMDVLDTAIDLVLDSMLGDDQRLKVVLTNPNGDTLEVEDEEDRGELWLRDMIVSLRLLDYIQPTINEIRRINGAPLLADGDRPYQPLGEEVLHKVQMTGSDQPNHVN